MNFLQDVLAATKLTSIRTAAKKIGVSSTLLYDIGNSTHCPKIESVELIKAKTGLNVADYLDDENKKKFEGKLSKKEPDYFDNVEKPLVNVSYRYWDAKINLNQYKDYKHDP